jgi:hypothetical protein
VTPLKAIDRFTSLTIIGMMKIMCNMMSHCTRKKKDVLTQDALAEPGLGGSPTTDEMIAFDG